jgi:hypothetical protein
LWLIIIGPTLLGILALVAIFATPLMWVGVVLLALIGVQYLVWGWWFERVYRSGREDVLEAEVVARPPKPPTSI